MLRWCNVLARWHRYTVLRWCNVHAQGGARLGLPHTHTHIYIFIYIYLFIYLFIYIPAFKVPVFLCIFLFDEEWVCWCFLARWTNKLVYLLLIYASTEIDFSGSWMSMLLTRCFLCGKDKQTCFHFIHEMHCHIFWQLHHDASGAMPVLDFAVASSWGEAPSSCCCLAISAWHRDWWNLDKDNAWLPWEVKNQTASVGARLQDDRALLVHWIPMFSH